MKREFSDYKELAQYFSSNRTEYKDKAIEHMDDIVQLNRDMTYDDLATIVTPEFYNDIHDNTLEFDDVLDKHFMNHLDNHKRESFIALHDFYNR